MKVFIVILF